MKAKIEKLDDQTNIDKYRIAANITEYHQSKIYDEKAIISCKKCIQTCQISTCLKWTYRQNNYNMPRLINSKRQK